MMVEEEVGSPEGMVICRPATLPWTSWPASMTAPWMKSPDFTLWTEDVTSAFFWVP